jgi:hypothetical protein
MSDKKKTKDERKEKQIAGFSWPHLVAAHNFLAQEHFYFRTHI